MSRRKAAPKTIALTPAILAGVQARMAKMAELQEQMAVRQNELEWFIARETGADLIYEHWTLDLDHLCISKES